jgi:hypothetical protein
MTITKPQIRKIIYGLQKAVEYYKSILKSGGCSIDQNSSKFCRKQIKEWNKIIRRMEIKLTERKKYISKKDILKNKKV